MAKYRKTSRDKMIERANARKNQGTGGKCLTFAALDKNQKVEFFKPKKSVHNLDVIGYVLTDPKNPECDDNLKPGYLWYGRNYWVHRGVGAEDDSYVCLAKTFGEPCPICEYAKQRRASGDATKEELDALKPRQRQLYNVIDLDEDPKKILLFDTSYHLFGRQLDKEILDADDEEIGGFFEPTEGFTLRARFDKKSFNGREFYECDRIDFKDRKKQYSEDIVDETYPLDDLLNHLTYDQLNEIFVMGAEANAPSEVTPQRLRKHEIEKENEDREEAVRERRASKRRRPEPDEDEDEPEDSGVHGSEDGDDDDDTPPPPRRKARRSPEPEDDDDDTPPPPKRKTKREEPEDEGDDDDTPPPPKRGKRVKPEPEPEEDEDDTPPSPKRGRKARTEDADEDDGGKCPHGLKWGKDNDTADECDDCKKWAGCNAAQRKMR